MLVTTEKDWVRLPENRDSPLGELKFRSRPLSIALQFDDESVVEALLAAKGQSEELSGFGVGFGVALERGGGVDIGLLQFDAPIAEFIQRNGAAGDGTAHEGAGCHHLDLAVEDSEAWPRL